MDVWGVGPSSEWKEEFWIVCLYAKKWSYAIGGNVATRKSNNTLVEWIVFANTERMKSADLKDKFFLQDFCIFTSFLDVGKGRRLPYAA